MFYEWEIYNIAVYPVLTYLRHKIRHTIPNGYRAAQLKLHAYAEASKEDAIELANHP